MSTSLASRLAAKQASQNAQALQNSQDQRINLPPYLKDAVQDPSPVEKLEVDALALSKIAKHSSENKNATGICLGLDILSVLQITNVFQSYTPLINTGNPDEDERKSKILRNQYNSKMCRNLSDVDLDDQPVGIYIAIEFGATINEILLSYAPLLSALGKNKGFVLLYDTSSASNGNLNLRAYKIQENFIQALRTNQFSEKGIIENQLTFNDILQEYPIELKSSSLTKAYLESLSTPETPTDSTVLSKNSTKILQLDLDSPLQANIDNLVESLDSYKDEQSQLAFANRHLLRERAKVEQNIQKLQQQRQSQNLAPLSETEIQRQFKLPAEPSKLPSLVLQGQLDGISQRLSDNALSSISMTHPDGLSDAS